MAKKKTSYKEAIAEIEETIALIENEELDVDELSEKVKRVSELLVLCKNKLNAAEKEMEATLNEPDE